MAQTSVQQWCGAVFIGAISSGARAVGCAAVGVEVDHEVRLLPAIFLQRPTQLLVGPDQLKHLACPAHLTIRTFTVDKKRNISLQNSLDVNMNNMKCKPTHLC